MLKEKINQGAKVYFGTMEYEVLEILSDNRLKLSVRADNGQASLPPLYTRNICRLHTVKGTFGTTGEIVERYKSENLYMVEMELQEGLYQIHESPQPARTCEEHALFSFGVESAHMEIIVKSATTEGVVFCLSDGQLLSEQQLREGRQYGEVTMWQMCLTGKIMEEKTEDESGCYYFKFEELPIDTQKKLTENILLGGRKL